ncbi:MAG TPA: histidine kinase [Burkholderiaceae bacterium]|nr:histidine kinase [Burkholderiaceae bacterium]
MNPDTLRTFKQILTEVIAWLKHTFDQVATWVTQLSWWKFILFACITLMIGGILQDNLFSSSREPVVILKKKNDHSHTSATTRNFSDGDTDIKIDSSGIHISSNKPVPAPDKAMGDKSGKDDEEKPDEESADDSSKESSKESSKASSKASASAQSSMSSESSKKQPAVTQGRGDIHINLPPEVAKEVGDAMHEAVDDAAAQQVEGYRENSSKWFMNFVVLLVVGLFGTKALMGGKKRAEAQAMAANAAAEREALQRQVTEAKMQMMQAQVEPHFLFNTLASVEHLIETNPPRASAMQRSLILYLRAVLPQMRETAAITNLGREADMVRAYLDLLKMRMEERLHVDFQVPEGLRSAAFPPMMLQSLVENAIKHGLEAKEEGGTLSVVAEVAHNKLRVSVIDDGMGFGVVPSTSTGLGLQSIRERLKLLHGQNGQLIIVPNTPCGVRSTIEVPYQLAV